MKAKSGVKLGGTFYFELWRPFGIAKWLYKEYPEITKWLHDNGKLFHKLIWADTGHNLVVNVGLQHILDILFVSATTQIDPWLISLLSATPTVAAADTMASHGGWTENENYSEGVRQTFVDVRSSQTVSNSASKAAFSIDTNAQSIGGAFLTSDNTKGGSSGTLLSGVAFTGGNKAADDGDTLNVQYDFGAADDGA